MRFRIKSEPNEVLRDRWVQKYAPLLTGYGFTIPDPDLRHDPDTGRWEIGPIDWSHLKATLDNAGPDSARRIGDAARHWSDTEWVRDALDAVAVGGRVKVAIELVDGGPRGGGRRSTIPSCPACRSSSSVCSSSSPSTPTARCRSD